MSSRWWCGCRVAPAAGVLGKILKGKGATAKVGEVIGYLEAGAAKAMTNHLSRSSQRYRALLSA